MIVLKFGGTSVGSAKNIARVTEIIQGALDKKPIVVVSAVAKMTDALTLLAQEAVQNTGAETLACIHTVHETILNELELDTILLDKEFAELAALIDEAHAAEKLEKKMLDHFQSFGERLCAKIVAAALTKRNIAAQSFPAWEIGMITNDEFGDAEPLPESTALISANISTLTVVPVITGFIGKTKNGDITTLGRGGSDYTAAIIGAALKAEAIQIWKEVDGFMTTDPRLVPGARVVSELAFEEAAELAYFGAKVLHPKTIQPAMKAEVPVHILNTFQPQGAGTRIVSNFKQRKLVSQAIDALTLKKNIAVVHVFSPEFFEGNEILADIFDLFGDHHVNIGDIALSVASVSLVIDSADALPPQILTKLNMIGEVVVDTKKAMICCVGGSLNTAAVVGRLFTVLGEHKIAVEFISQASSGYSIAFVVDEKDAETAVQILHKEYIR